MGYIIGIDQGGTKTHVAVMAKDGLILSYSETDGCYFPEEGISLAVTFVIKAAKEALDKANVDISEVEIVVAGVTGVDYDGDEAIVIKALAQVFSNQRIIVCNDIEIAYYSGTLKPVGAVICAGTGINAALFAPDGSSFVLSDYFKSSLQGGAAIARRMIEAIVEADLGVWPASELTEVFLDFAQENTINNLLRRYVRTDDFATNIISLVPQIIESANNGDRLARLVLSDYAVELSACFTAALRRMKMDDLACDIVITGSVFKGKANYLTGLLTEKILESARQAQVINARYEPIVGACILGMIKLTGSYSEEMDCLTGDSAKQLGLLRTAVE